jgi:2'-5' RNA ligase
LFVAVALPDEVRSELARAAAAVEASVPGARAVPPENLHLTLKFLGRVEGDSVDAVSRAVAAVAARARPFRARLDGVGAFPNERRARVAWAGLRDEAGELRALAAAVSGAVEPLGFAREEREWRAHVTIARVKPPAPAPRLAEMAVAPLTFEVRALTLFSSTLGRPAARYTPLAEHPLAGA